MGSNATTHLERAHSKVVGILMLVGVVMLFSLPIWRQVASTPGNRVIARGVKLPGLELGGMNEHQSIKAIEQWANEIATHSLQVRLRDKSWSLTPKQISWQVDAAAIAKEAIELGRQGALPRRWLSRVRMAWSGAVIYPTSEASAKAIRSWLSKLEGEVYQPPYNAYRDLNSGVVIREKTGRQLDIAASVANIQTALVNKADAVELAVLTLQPRITYDEAVKTHAPVAIARFSTRFNASTKNRVANIRLAAAMINGIIVPPGSIFSFNEIVGPRLITTGYREAPELLKGELRPGIGGGVCQVSSTLYNAVLLSNLRVVERYKHSAVLGYVAAGRDATVAYGQLDFRFQNTLDFPIVIRTFVEKDHISVSLWGRAKLPYQVKLFSESRSLPVETVERLDASLQPGKRLVAEEGKPGQLVTISKQVISESGDSRKSVVSKNLYASTPRVVKVGPTPTPKQSKPFLSESLQSAVPNSEAVAQDKAVDSLSPDSTAPDSAAPNVEELQEPTLDAR